MLRRFGFVYDKTIEDEQEKQWVHDALVEMASWPRGRDGSTRCSAPRACSANLVQAETISWPLRVL